ncbi:hypothetical protein J6590_060846 [Homalodisca vitripennis]|nr:hypothetical protein J6590_060846 [Homalodisca vitripennis]
MDPKNLSLRNAEGYFNLIRSDVRDPKHTALSHSDITNATYASDVEHRKYSNRQTSYRVRETPEHLFSPVQANSNGVSHHFKR